jgi:hypothetical protein
MPRAANLPGPVEHLPGHDGTARSLRHGVLTESQADDLTFEQVTFGGFVSAAITNPFQPDEQASTQARDQHEQQKRSSCTQACLQSAFDEALEHVTLLTHSRL